MADSKTGAEKGQGMPGTISLCQEERQCLKKKTKKSCQKDMGGNQIKEASYGQNWDNLSINISKDTKGLLLTG